MVQDESAGQVIWIVDQRGVFHNPQGKNRQEGESNEQDYQ